MIVTHHLRILIVEDDAIVGLALAETCERAGYSVTCLGDGYDGLRVFAAAPFDVVITDLNMPGCDGRRMMRDLRAEWPCLPIIVVTADPSAGGVRELNGDDPGVTILFHKSLQSNALLTVLHALFMMEDSTVLRSGEGRLSPQSVVKISSPP